MTLDSLPDLEYKRVVSCKDSFHGTDLLAVPEHGAPGRRPNIHTHFVGRQREDGLDTLPARAAEANRSTLIADVPFPALIAARIHSVLSAGRYYNHEPPKHRRSQPALHRLRVADLALHAGSAPISRSATPAAP